MRYFMELVTKSALAKKHSFSQQYAFEFVKQKNYFN